LCQRNSCEVVKVPSATFATTSAITPFVEPALAEVVEVADAARVMGSPLVFYWHGI
jgi:hypothetical protein